MDLSDVACEVVEEPVFIVGVTRSGTTLLEHILNRHPNLSIYHESHFLRKVWAKSDTALLDGTRVRDALDQITNLPSDPQSRQVIEERFQKTDKSLRALFDTVLRSHMEKNGKARMGEKTPSNFWFLDVLFDWYPRAKVIFMIRNPHNVLGSFKKFKAMRGWPRHDRTIIGRAFYWNYGARVLKESLTRYPGQIKCVMFESLINEPGATLRDLCEFLDEDYYEDVLNIRAVNSSFDETRKQTGFRKETLHRQSNLNYLERLVIDLVSGAHMQEAGYPLEILPRRLFVILRALGFYQLLDSTHNAIRNRSAH